MARDNFSYKKFQKELAKKKKREEKEQRRLAKKTMLVGEQPVVSDGASADVAADPGVAPDEADAAA